MKCLEFVNKEYLSESNPFKGEQIICISNADKVEKIWKMIPVNNWVAELITKSKDVWPHNLADVVKKICYSKSEVDAELKKIICLLNLLETNLVMETLIKGSGVELEDMVLDFSEIYNYRLDTIIEILGNIAGNYNVNVVMVLNNVKYSIAEDFLYQYCKQFKGEKIKNIMLGKYSESDAGGY